MKCKHCSASAKRTNSLPASGACGQGKRPRMLLGLASLSAAGPGSLVTTSTAWTDRHDDQDTC